MNEDVESWWEWVMRQVRPKRKVHLELTNKQDHVEIRFVEPEEDKESDGKEESSS